MNDIKEQDELFSLSKDIIRKSIHNIYGILYLKENIDFNMEDINLYYTQIYNYLVNDEDDQNGKKMYELYCSELEDFYNKSIIPKINISINFIEDIAQFYNYDQLCIKYLSSLILRYLERYYIKNNGIKSIKEKSKDIFENTIYLKYESRIIDLTIENLNNYRNNKVDEDTMKPLFTIISLFNDLNENNIIYKNIKESSKIYFQNYKSDLIEKYCYQQYYEEIELAYLREEKLFKNIFSDELYNNYNKYLNEIIIENQIEKYNKEDYISNCILKKNNEEMITLFTLLNKVNKEKEILLPVILKCFKEEIQNLELTNHSIENYITELIDLNENYDYLFENIKNKNTKFSNIICTFVNEYKKILSTHLTTDVKIKNKKYGIIKLLVTHINYYLTKKQSLLEREFLDKYLKIVLVSQEKDYYLELYSKYLAKRLLFNKYDLDKEKEIINDFKKTMGFSATIKVENMIKDIMLHNDNSDRYKVLTLSHWPIYKNTKCALPNELREKLKEYTQKYNETFSQRKVEWNNDISTVTIYLNLNRKYQITMSVIEYCIIKLFSKKDKYQIREMVEELDMDESHTFMYIDNLIQYKILNSEDEKIDLSSIISFNKDFSYKKICFSLPKPSVDKSQEEMKNKQEVNENRMEIIKAAIVRIMKSKKTLDHNNLIIEVNKNINLFTPQVKDIKKSVENLIEREYLERCDDQANKYNYLA